MRISALNRIFILQITLACLCAVLLIVLEIRWFGHHQRMSADSTYSPAPLYGPLRGTPSAVEGLRAAPTESTLRRGEELRITHPAIQRAPLQITPQQRRLQRLMRRRYH